MRPTSTTEDGGVVICEAPATGTSTAGSDRAYPACGAHVGAEVGE